MSIWIEIRCDAGLIGDYFDTCHSARGKFVGVLCNNTVADVRKAVENIYWEARSLGWKRQSLNGFVHTV